MQATPAATAMAAPQREVAPDDAQGRGLAMTDSAPPSLQSQGAVMQRMVEAQAAQAAAQAEQAAQAEAQAAKQERMMEQMMEQQRVQLEQQAAMKAQQDELKAQQDREMALLAEEFRKLGSNTDFAAAGAAGKKSSTRALQWPQPAARASRLRPGVSPMWV